MSVWASWNIHTNLNDLSDVQVRIDLLNSRWMSSLMCGVTCQSPEKMHFPLTALGFKKNSWIICSDSVFVNGVKVRTMYGTIHSSCMAVALLALWGNCWGRRRREWWGIWENYVFEELRSLYVLLPNIFRVIKWRRMRWVGHAVEVRNMYRIGFDRPKGKRRLWT